MKKIVGIWPHNRGLKAEIEGLFPDDANVVPAIPGGPGPVVAVRELPPFACDALLVTDRSALYTAVAVALRLGVKLVPMREQLSDMLGGDVKEVGAP